MNMTAFRDEYIKIAASAGEVTKFLAKNWKLPAAAGGGVAAFLTGKQAKDDWKLGRTYRKAMEKRQGG